MNKLTSVLVSSFSTVLIALLSAGVSFLYDLSTNIQELNKQVAVVITQVGSNEKNFQFQVSAHKERLDSVEDQLRILNDRTSYITRYINEKRKDEQ